MRLITIWTAGAVSVRLHWVMSFSLFSKFWCRNRPGDELKDKYNAFVNPLLFSEEAPEIGICMYCIIVQLWTCSIENVWRVTFRYRTVRIALYMFHTCFTSERVFLACTDETHTLLRMSGLAVAHYLLSTGNHHSSGAALSLVLILATDS